MDFKKSVLTFHRWLGLLTGLVVFVVAITGAIFTFENEISQIAYSYRKVEKQEKEHVSIQKIKEVASAHLNKINAIYFYGDEQAIRVRERGTNPGGERFNNWVYLNPYTGEILHTKLNGELNFFDIVIQLHMNLLLGKTGNYIVKYSTLIFLFVLVSGIYIWWPKNKNGRRQRLTLNWNKSTKLKRKNLDIHTVLGFYTSLVIFFAVITGLAWSFEWIDKTIYAVSTMGKPYKSWPNPTSNSNTLIIPAKSIEDSIMHTGLQYFNKPALRKRFYFPSDTSGTFLLALSPSRHVYYKDHYYYFDQRTGELLNTYNPSTQNNGQYLSSMYYDIHSGAILGLAGRLLMFFACLITASLPVTGFFIWYTRKKEQQNLKTQFLNNQSNETLIAHTERRHEHRTLILYATRSGNSKKIAQLARDFYHKQGIKTVLSNTKMIGPQQLYKYNRLLVVISTDGNGVPPAMANEFYKKLFSKDMRQLKHLSYSVCALGDSSYEKFCETGKQIDTRLSLLGAMPIYPKVECDTDFADKATSWIKSTFLAQYGNNTNLNTNFEIVENRLRKGVIKYKTLLSTVNCNKPCYHIEIKSGELLTDIKPGDSVEIYPKNLDWLVDEICRLMNFTSAQTKNLLTNQYEITSLTKNTIERYQSFANIDKLKELLLNNSELKKYLAKANFADLLMDYPSALTDENLKDILPKKKGRLYSVASSTKLYPNELHLTVKAIRYNFKSRLHEGAGSVELTENIKVNDILSFKHYPNFEFRLPEDNSIPVILIGVGTGIAPFRAFLQENQYHESCSDIWLIWGDKHKEIDFIYEQELLDFQDKGILKKLNLAFSQDGEEKIYVQDLIKQNKAEFIEWVDKGAHIYVCGSLSMADNVKGIIEKILNQPETGIKFSDMADNYRYHEDAY